MPNIGDTIEWPNGERWLMVWSRETPNLVLTPADHPAWREFRDAMLAKIAKEAKDG